MLPSHSIFACNYLVNETSPSTLISTAPRFESPSSHCSRSISAQQIGLMFFFTGKQPPDSHFSQHSQQPIHLSASMTNSLFIAMTWQQHQLLESRLLAPPVTRCNHNRLVSLLLTALCINHDYLANILHIHRLQLISSSHH